MPSYRLHCHPVLRLRSARRGVSQIINRLKTIGLLREITGDGFNLRFCFKLYLKGFMKFREARA
jgi:hypothetical protein